MFSSKGTTSALWKSLAIDFQDSLIVAQARDTHKLVVKGFNVDTFPTLVVLPGGSAPGIVYTGKMERDSMYEFLSKYARAPKQQEPTPEEAPVKPKQEPLGILITETARL
jgi:protein disulfide-isomerase A6